MNLKLIKYLIYLIFVILFFRYVGSKKVKVFEYFGFEELVIICIMCNDFSVDYNEVRFFGIGIVFFSFFLLAISILNNIFVNLLNNL